MNGSQRAVVGLWHALFAVETCGWKYMCPQELGGVMNHSFIRSCSWDDIFWSNFSRHSHVVRYRLIKYHVIAIRGLDAIRNIGLLIIDTPLVCTTAPSSNSPDAVGTMNKLDQALAAIQTLIPSTLITNCLILLETVCRPASRRVLLAPKVLHGKRRA